MQHEVTLIFRSASLITHFDVKDVIHHQILQFNCTTNHVAPRQVRVGLAEDIKNFPNTMKWETGFHQTKTLV